MAMMEMNFSEIDRLQKAMEEYQGDTEAAINDVLHNEAGAMIQEGINLYMPFSGVNWKGKKPPARLGKSLRNINAHLSVTVTTTGNYHYLYFPDDGTNTRRHIGNQQFFRKGGELMQSEIVDRCINRLVTEFEKGV